MLSWAGGPCGCCRISVLHGVVCYQLFSWWLWFQLPWDHWQDPLASSGLIPHRSHDHWNSTRWDLAWSPKPREIDSYFVFLPIVNNHTNCCHLLTKLLGDGLVVHSPLCRSTILSLTSLDSSLVLAMVESLESDGLIASVDRCLFISEQAPFKRVLLSQLLTCIKDTWEPEILLIDRWSNTYLTH